MAPAFSEGSAPGAGGLRLWFDADQVEALAVDRTALWERVAAADFLTVNEKRAAVGYEPVAGGDGLAARLSHQTRVHPRLAAK